MFSISVNNISKIFTIEVSMTLMVTLSVGQSQRYMSQSNPIANMTSNLLGLMCSLFVTISKKFTVEMCITMTWTNRKIKILAFNPIDLSHVGSTPSSRSNLPGQPHLLHDGGPGWPPIPAPLSGTGLIRVSESPISCSPWRAMQFNCRARSQALAPMLLHQPARSIATLAYAYPIDRPAGMTGWIHKKIEKSQDVYHSGGVLMGN